MEIEWADRLNLGPVSTPERVSAGREVFSKGDGCGSQKRKVEGQKGKDSSPHCQCDPGPPRTLPSTGSRERLFLKSNEEKPHRVLTIQEVNICSWLIKVIV